MGKGRIYFGGPFQNSCIVFIMETDPFSGTLTYLLTYSMEQSPSGSAASQEIPCIFGTRRFITVLTSARHLSLS